MLFADTICFLQSSICNLFLFAAFPRGPGFYFDLIKFGLVLVVYLAWVRTTWWIDNDSKELGLPSTTWDGLVLGAGLLGLLIVWALPIFWPAFIALLALFLAPTFVYVGKRNEKVPEEEKVCTPDHLRALAKRYLKLDFGRPVKDPKKKAIPIRFIGKSGDKKGEESARARRAQESPQYRLAMEMVYGAIVKRATDIHLEPTEDEMTVRLRIDGMLQPAPGMTRDEGDAVLNIIKVLADLDITEKRKPQDGSFSAEVQSVAEVLEKKRPIMGVKAEEGDEEEDDGLGERVITREVDFRVATAGSVEGEKLVMRILDRSRQINDLPRLGMPKRLREQISTIVGEPYGLFVVCGPTGAGKSTTLYACLAEIDRYSRNVITVENPVEYHIDNVTQIEVNPKAGKTFASELRSILRQDPDVIYIGEIRDEETAEIACQAAQTGHMVFTTLHANDTVMALGRLLNLGIEPFMVATSLTAVLSQRLVRVLCPKCKVAYRPNPELLRRANLPVDRIKAFYRPPKPEDRAPDEGPCEHCGSTGYRGRTGIFELLVINEKIRELIKANPNIDAIRNEAVKSGGLVLLQQDGMRVVIEGKTSIDELLRVAK
jgi:type II secretory ATPase GspE/PulE/Tfp pilus assembly ATPase PilB-like protein